MCMASCSQDQSGEWVFKLPVPPHAEIPWTDPMTSVGPVNDAIFSDPEKYQGATIPVLNELLSPSKMAQQFAEVIGCKAR